MRRLLLPLILASLALAACGEKVEDTRPGQPVKHRQEAFKGFIRSFEPMGTMLRDDKYEQQAFAHLVQALIAQREAPWSYFGADTDYPPSKSTADVWKRPEAFEAERQRFIAATDALGSAAASGDKATVQKAYDAVYDSCKSCHKQFRK